MESTSDEFRFAAARAGLEHDFVVRDFVRLLAVDIILALTVRLLGGLGFLPTGDSRVYAALTAKIVFGCYLFWMIFPLRGAWPRIAAGSWGRWQAWAVFVPLYFATFYFLNTPLQLFNHWVMSVVYGWFGLEFAPTPQLALWFALEGGLGTVAWALLVFFIVIVGPILEEIAFRGIGLAACSRVWGIPAAVAITTVVFGLYHHSLQLIIPTACLGLLFCLARVYSGSLRCAAAMHIIHNLTALLYNAWQEGLL